MYYCYRVAVYGMDGWIEETMRRKEGWKEELNSVIKTLCSHFPHLLLISTYSRQNSAQSIVIWHLAVRMNQVLSLSAFSYLFCITWEFIRIYEPFSLYLNLYNYFYYARDNHILLLVYMHAYVHVSIYIQYACMKMYVFLWRLVIEKSVWVFDSVSSYCVNVKILNKVKLYSYSTNGDENKAVYSALSQRWSVGRQADKDEQNLVPL